MPLQPLNAGLYDLILTDALKHKIQALTTQQASLENLDTANSHE